MSAGFLIMQLQEFCMLMGLKILNLQLQLLLTPIQTRFILVEPEVQAWIFLTEVSTKLEFIIDLLPKKKSK